MAQPYENKRTPNTRGERIKIENMAAKSVAKVNEPLIIS